MGIAQKPQKAKLFLAVMFVDGLEFEESLKLFVEQFGETDAQCGPLEVAPYTDFYTGEMGAGIRKQYLSFRKLIERGQLSSIKICTNEIEKKFLKNGTRRVNLDPGYITSDKLVLATTKDFYHRIYLNDGIYAEVTLHYRHGKYRYFSWTYPDYRERLVLEFFEKTREGLMGKLKECS